MNEEYFDGAVTSTVFLATCNVFKIGVKVKFCIF